MAVDLSVMVGNVRLKNPVIAGAAEHMIHAEGVRAALASGVGAVVMKSNNEVENSKDQLERSEYTLLDENWRQVPWNDAAPRSVTLACRSGMSPLPFDQWLEQAVRLDREAKAQDSYLVASLILGALDSAVEMARKVEQAGIRVMEFNVGVPYGSQTAKGNVATELSTDGISKQVAAIRQAVNIPVWVKTSGQSEQVPALAGAAFDSGADAVIMAGRLLGFLPDPETQKPLFGTSLGIGGFWHLPITCHWLAMTRKALGPDKPLIGINGAQTGNDVLRMMLAGATAVEIASSVMYAGFPALGRAVEEISAYFRDRGTDAAAIVGLAGDEHKTFMQMPRQEGNWRNYVPTEALPPQKS
jgi:dihydroorotate dehydrogenase